MPLVVQTWKPPLLSGGILRSWIDTARLSASSDLVGASRRRPAPLALERRDRGVFRRAEAVPRLLALFVRRGGWFRGVVPSQRRRCSPDCRRWQYPIVRPLKFVVVASERRGWPSREVLGKWQRGL